MLQLSGVTAASVVLTGPPAFAAGDAGTAASAGRRTAPTGLLADLLPQALVASPAAPPRFSWEVPDFGDGAVQQAYRLQVAATPTGFEGRHLVWDSGRKASAASTAVP
jgi:alpha-L-rhamnosidase